MVIPERFTRNVDAHLLGNYLGIDHFPLILVISGKPGAGKTYQLRNYLGAIDVSPFSISAADLESFQAGRPAKLIQEKYISASSRISEGKPTALLIDDIDTTLGEWENNTGTVNHQTILAFLMHIADNPIYIDGFGEVNRVPIFFTGNNIDRLYAPLMRKGRASHFIWEPTRSEKAQIIKSLYKLDSIDAAIELVDLFPEESMSFFSNMLSSRKVNALAETAKNVVFSRVINQSDYRERILNDFIEISESEVVKGIIRDAKQYSNYRALHF